MKSILYTFGIALVLTFMLQSCSFNSVRGNGVIVEKDIKISDYKEIDFSGGCNLVYEQKNDTPAYIRIETDENIYPLLIVEVKNDVLTIKSKENINPTKYNIYTNSSSLKGISSSGSIKAYLKGKLETSDLNISVSGSGNITADSLLCNSFYSQISGSGDIVLKGKTGTITSKISGSGKLNAMEMVADSVTCSVSGSGNFSVIANNYLKVNISGSGEVRYKGEPKIDQSISGSGKVIKEG